MAGESLSQEYRNTTFDASPLRLTSRASRDGEPPVPAPSATPLEHPNDCTRQVFPTDHGFTQPPANRCSGDQPSSFPASRIDRLVHRCQLLREVSPARGSSLPGSAHGSTLSPPAFELCTPLQRPPVRYPRVRFLLTFRNSSPPARPMRPPRLRLPFEGRTPQNPVSSVSTIPSGGSHQSFACTSICTTV